MLVEVNNYKPFGSLTPEQMVDIANNEVLTVDLCELIAMCIDDSEATQESIINFIEQNSTVQVSIQQAASNNGYNQSDGKPVEPEVNELDYIWNGLVSALPIFVDAVDEFFLLVNAAADASEAIINLVPGAIPRPAWYSFLKEAFNFGLATLETYLGETTTQEEFLCLIFDRICERGEPYYLEDEDILQAMLGLGDTGLPGFPSVGELPWPYFNFQKFKQLFALNTDAADNNWMALCGCNPETWIAVVDLTSVNFMSINGAFGNWTNGVGYSAVPDLVGGRNRKIIEAAFITDPFEFDGHEFTVTEVPVSPNNAFSVTRWGVDFVSPNVKQFDVLSSTDRVLDFSVTPGQTASHFSIQRIPAQPNNAGASSVITELRVFGTGDIPTQLLPYII